MADTSEASGGSICFQYESQRVSAQHLGPIARGRCCAFTLGDHRGSPLYRSTILAPEG